MSTDPTSTDITVWQAEVKRLRAALDFIATTADHNAGELYPVGRGDGCWHFLDGEGKTFLDAIEDEMRQASDNA